MGHILSKNLRVPLSQLVEHYCKFRPIYTAKKIKEVTGADSDELIRNLTTNKLATTKVKTTDTCDTCRRIADVKDAQRGICVCEQNHRTNRDPSELVEVLFNEGALTELLGQDLSKSLGLKLADLEDKEYMPFKYASFDLLGGCTISDLHGLVLAAYRELKPKDICLLQGLMSMAMYDFFAVFTIDISSETEEFVSRTSAGTIQIFPISKLIQQPENVGDDLVKVGEGYIAQTIRLASVLRKELQTAGKIVSPDRFRTMVQYDSLLVNQSFESATHGDYTKFEDICASLLGAIVPIKQLGHTTVESNGRIEIPDGVVTIPLENGQRLGVMFYDCKSVGTPNNRKLIKSIEQDDEDAFARYCRLFSSSRVGVKLFGGCFIANEFSPINLANKVRQLRSRGDIPQDVTITFMPLRSLV